MYMDDINLFAKNEMEFDIEKCALLIMKSGKQQITERIELLKKSKRSEKRKLTNTWGYWSRHHKTCGDERKKKKKKKKKRPQEIEKSNWNQVTQQKFLKEINTWGVSFVRYSGQILKWTGEELQ